MWTSIAPKCVTVERGKPFWDKDILYYRNMLNWCANETLEQCICFEPVFFPQTDKFVYRFTVKKTLSLDIVLKKFFKFE